MKSKKTPYIWISPLITLIIMLALYAIGGIFPFGTATTAFSDGIAQYVPLISELADKIREGGSLFFTWHAGMGVNFWTNIVYYLASPLNLIALFFEPAHMDDAYSIITLIKPVLMSLTFAIYLKYAYKKNDLSVVVFSVLWSLSGFMIGGMYITSWYDAIIYFPLVILGLKRLMDGKSAILYSVFLGLSIISSFYIGWMICIFSVIYFIYSFIADDEVAYEGTGVKDEDGESVNVFTALKNSYILSSFFRFAASSLIAGGLSAIFTIPAIYTLGNTVKGSTVSSVVNIKGIWGILASHIFPAQATYDVFSSLDHILVFAGTATVILAVAYFFTKGISLRKKIGNLFLLAVMWASIIFFAVYTVWHGFGIPAGLMYRFAFVYSFVLLKIAYEAFINIKNIPIYGILAGTVFALVCTSGIYFDSLLRKNCFSVSLIATVVFFIAIFTVLLLLMSKKVNLHSVLTVVLLLSVIGESVVLNRDNIRTYELESVFKDSETVKQAAQKLEPYEDLKYINDETVFMDMIMYGLLYGYNSSEYYSSMADGNFTRTVNNMGVFGNRQNSQNGAQEQTPIYNMMFPTEYYLDGTGNIKESFVREKIAEKDGCTLYKNNYVMPFMYTVSKDVKDWQPLRYLIVTDCQNSVLKALTGVKDDALIYNGNENFSYENCTHISYVDAIRELYEKDGKHLHEEEEAIYKEFENKMDSFAFHITDMSKSASFSFDTVAKTDGMMYFFLDTSEFTDLAIEINGKKTEYFAYGTNENRMYELGEVKKGDRARITIGGYLEHEDLTGNVYNVEEDIVSAIGFTIDREVLDKAYNKLDSMSDTEVLEFRDTYVKANVKSYEDGYLYVPTPCDEGWTVLIDGEAVPLQEHNSHVLMTEISKGDHTVEMKFTPVGFVKGAVITSACAAVLLAWAIIVIRKEKKK